MKETELLLSLDLSDISLKMPRSRITRCRYALSPPSKRWPRLIAETYDKNPVGSFARNFDKPLTSNIKCGNTILTFREFVEYKCEKFKVDLEEYYKLDDVLKKLSVPIQFCIWVSLIQAFICSLSGMLIHMISIGMKII